MLRFAMRIMAGSVPERRISFAALQNNVMALAVGKDEWAVRGLSCNPDTAAEPEIPNAPIWLSVPVPSCSPAQSPARGHPYVCPGHGPRERLVLSFRPRRHNVSWPCWICAADDEHDAAAIAGELSHATRCSIS